MVGHDGRVGENTMRRAGLGPTKCTATAKSSGARCKQWAIVGCTVCHKHGGGRKAVRANGDLRAVAAQLAIVGLAPDATVRIVQRVLSERMLAEAETLRTASEQGRKVSAEEEQRFIDASERALTAAAAAIRLGVEQQADTEREELTELVSGAVRMTIDAIMAVLPGGLKYWNDLHSYAVAMTAWALAPESARGERPDLPADPPEHLLPGYVHPTTYYGPGATAPHGSAQGPAVAELMPAPRRRRTADADSVWRAAQQIVDAEVVDDQEDGDGEEDGDGDGAAA